MPQEKGNAAAEEARGVPDDDRLGGVVSQESSLTHDNAQAIRAHLIGASTCSSAGLTVTGHPAPVLAMCRRLLEAGHNPATRLEVYRGATLALTVRSIGEGARLTVAEGDREAPRFRP